MLESQYINETPLDHRKNFGQFFTPSAVARLMTAWVMKNNPKTVLDPAFGLGVFYDEISRMSPKTDLTVIGYEIDPRIMGYLRPDRTLSNLHLIPRNYLEADPEFFDGIVCNPPYMRFQRFIGRHEVLPKIEKQIGKKLIGYSNISSVFLVKALKELKHNGNLAFIMPFEFFNAGYGSEIKKSLLEDHLLKQIVIFTNEKEIFPEAITTVCVLLCKRDGKEDDIKITRIHSGEEIDAISDISEYYQKQILPANLPCNRKWTPIILSLFSEQYVPDAFCKLSLYGAVTRGIATGANDFFALRQSDIHQWRLEDRDICKCITKSSQIRQPVFTNSDLDRLYQADRPVFCLDIKNHTDQAVRAYIAEGEKLGYHIRYLTRTRAVWYKIENRKPAPILFGVFNRGRLKVVRNLTSAINFTCFHAFYPNLFGERLVNKLFVYFLSDAGQKIVKINQRRYGDALDKFEPGDLNDSLCPNQKQFEVIEDRDADKVVDIARSDEAAAIRISNQCVEKILNSL